MTDTDGVIQSKTAVNTCFLKDGPQKYKFNYVVRIVELMIEPYSFIIL